MSLRAVFPDGGTPAPEHNTLLVEALSAGDAPMPYNTVSRPPLSTPYRPALYTRSKTGPQALLSD